MTPNRRIFLNIVATYVSPEGVARVAKRALCGVRILYAKEELNRQGRILAGYPALAPMNRQVVRAA